ncbi:hypothetical protein ACWDPF_27255 [Streptomyces albogriseolus]
MTAQGGDLLAWLESAITKAEADADRWHDAECSFHETTLIDVTVLQGGATLCDCEGPASVRRRCAADRKALSFYSETVAIRDRSAATLRAGQERGSEPDRRVLDDWNRANREAAHMLPLIQLLAEGYGWAEETSLADGQGQTPPTEGDRMT